MFATVGKEFGDAKTELAATQKALAEYGKKLRDGAKDVSDGAAALQEGVDAGANDAKDGVGRLQQEMCIRDSLKACFATTGQVDSFVESLQRYGKTQTQIVLSTVVEPREVEPLL